MKMRRVLAIGAACALAVAAEAATPKRVLVFSKCEGFNHKASIAACKAAMADEAKKGAFTVDFSDDYAAFKIENLLKYDARGQLLRRARVLPPRGRPLRRPSVGRGRHVGVQG